VNIVNNATGYVDRVDFSAPSPNQGNPSQKEFVMKVATINTALLTTTQRKQTTMAMEP